MHPVEVIGLSKNYGDLTAVREVSFHIADGEIFGLLGPNGSGKTSTINMLTGLSAPDAGTVAICGADPLQDPRDARKRMALVPDESNLYEDMDGISNLIFCSALYGIRRKDSEPLARSMIGRFGLEEAGNRPFRSYSKGMKRRLTIAAALMVSPKVLLLDEPTTGIDVESSLFIRREISKLRDAGVAVLLTTHNIEEAESLCDRVAFIVEGSIIKTDSVEGLLGGREREVMLRLSLDSGPARLIDPLKIAFPQLVFQPLPPKGLNVSVPRGHNISALVSALDDMGVAVLEVRAERPTLQEVFIRVTGLIGGVQGDEV